MNFPTVIVDGQEDQCRQPIGIARVSHVAHREEISTTSPAEVGTLTDVQREEAILRAGQCLERHMSKREAALLEYDITGDFAAKGLADRHRLMADYALHLQMDLIRGRSAAAVARMESERGLA